MKNKTIIDYAQYNDFFRVLSYIVHAEGYRTPTEKKEALLYMVFNTEDRHNLEEFTSWFYKENKNEKV